MTDKESDIALMDALMELAETAAIYGDYNGESGRTYNKANEVLTLIKSDRERAVREARINQIQVDFLKYSVCTDVDESELIAIRDSLANQLKEAGEL